MTIFEIYKRLLEIHIASKTACKNFHADTETAYDLAFDCFHLTEEMKQNLGEAKPLTPEDAEQEAYDLMEELKTLLKEEMDGDTGMDNLARSLYEKVNGACGDLKRYLPEKSETEEMDEEEEKPTKKSIFK